MKKKYWVGMAEHGLFTKNDNHLLFVHPWGQVGNKGVPLESHFVEADDIESAREKLHAFIDERLDHEIHMAGLEKAVAKNEEKRAKYKASEPIPDEDVSQLSIGEFVNENPKAGRSETDGVMNLEDLL